MQVNSPQNYSVFPGLDFGQSLELGSGGSALLSGQVAGQSTLFSQQAQGNPLVIALTQIIDRVLEFAFAVSEGFKNHGSTQCQSRYSKSSGSLLDRFLDLGSEFLDTVGGGSGLMNIVGDLFGGGVMKTGQKVGGLLGRLF